MSSPKKPAYPTGSKIIKGWLKDCYWKKRQRRCQVEVEINTLAVAEVTEVAEEDFGFQRRNNDNRQIEMKFHPYGASGSSRPTLATFAQVKEALILKIEKDYEWGKDIDDSIQQMS